MMGLATKMGLATIVGMTNLNIKKEVRPGITTQNWHAVFGRCVLRARLRRKRTSDRGCMEIGHKDMQ
uniref:Secreted protein n=1 Tax=Steinernema glaseri TaxID=37863 RepID=A0A1I7ZAR5_9BILA